MSAENAWRIAMAAAREPAGNAALLRRGEFDDALYAAARVRFRIDEVFDSLPMPPAFRAEVEAETEELRGALASLVSSSLALLDHCQKQGMADNIMAELFPEERGRPDRLPYDEQARQARRAMNELRAAIAPARALLSRLEAKGESHE